LVLACVLAIPCLGCGGAEQSHKRGLKAMEAGDYSKAIDEFSKVVEAYPNLIAGYGNRGDAHMALATEDPTQLEYAIADYTAALELQPTSQESTSLYERRSRAYVFSNQPQLALRDLERVIAVQATNHVAYWLRADCRIKLNNLAGAVEDLKKASDIAPDVAEIRLELARALKKTGQLNKAAAAATAYLKLAAPGDRAKGYEELADIFTAAGQDGRAIAQLSELIKLMPNDGAAYRKRGVALLKTGKTDRALTDLERAIELDANDLQAIFQRGSALLLKGQFDEANRDFGVTIEKAPGFVAAYLKRAVSRDASGDWEGAVADLTLAISKEPRLPDTYLQRGRLYLKKGQHENAIKDFTMAIERKPSIVAFRARGKAYKAAGEEEKAKEDEAEAVRLETRKRRGS